MQATATVTIPVHLRDEALSANGRQHWRVKAARTASLRNKSAVLHRDATFTWQPIDPNQTSTPVNAMAALGRREGEETR